MKREPSRSHLHTAILSAKPAAACPPKPGRFSFCRRISAPVPAFWLLPHTSRPPRTIENEFHIDFPVFDRRTREPGSGSTPGRDAVRPPSAFRRGHSVPGKPEKAVFPVWKPALPWLIPPVSLLPCAETVKALNTAGFSGHWPPWHEPSALLPPESTGFLPGSQPYRADSGIPAVSGREKPG